MKFEPVEKVLKNGARVLIREAVKKDAAALLQAVATYLTESKNLISTIEEFNHTISQQERWIQQLSENSNSILLVALYKGKIIGNIDLKGETRKRIKHNALLGIGILSNWQNLGLGKMMLECVTGWAKKNPAIENIWLNVFENHTTAIRLYEQIAFKKIAVEPAYVRRENGLYINNIMMQLQCLH